MVGGRGRVCCWAGEGGASVAEAPGELAAFEPGPTGLLLLSNTLFNQNDLFEAPSSEIAFYILS